MSAAPAGAEALAAFLYWQVVTSANPTTADVNAGATFNGAPLNVPLGTQLLPTRQRPGGRDSGVPAQRRARQEGVHVPIRRPAIPRRGPHDRRACHQQGGWVSGRVHEQRHDEDPGRQPGRDLSESRPRDAVERDCDVRRHVRETAVRHDESEDRGVLRSGQRARDRLRTWPEVAREIWGRSSPDRSPRRRTGHSVAGAGSAWDNVTLATNAFGRRRDLV